MPDHERIIGVRHESPMLVRSHESVYQIVKLHPLQRLRDRFQIVFANFWVVGVNSFDKFISLALKIK